MIFTTAFAVTDAQVFTHAEANYPGLFSWIPVAGQIQQYDYRLYQGRKNYLAVDTSGMICVWGPISGNEIVSVGTEVLFADTIFTGEATQTPAASPAALAGTWTHDGSSSSSTYTFKPDGSFDMVKLYINSSSGFTINRVENYQAGTVSPPRLPSSVRCVA